MKGHPWALLLLLLLSLYCPCVLPVPLLPETFDLPTCLHNFQHAMGVAQRCAFINPVRLSDKGTVLIQNRKKRPESLACPLAFNRRLALPRGVKQPCLINGTAFVVAPDIAEYLDEMMKAVLGYHTQAFKGVVDGSEWPPDTMPHVLTMVGFRRLHNVQSLLEDAIFRGVPGDFIETGVWRGGLCLVAAALFQAYGQFPQRKVWLADSFQGIPPSTWRVDRRFHRDSHELGILNNNSLAAVRQSFHRYGLLSDNIQWLPGYFNETLPPARSQWTSFAVIRLDGDLYQSVYESFVNLYPFLSPGGYAIIDDYWDWVGARLATETYMKEQGVAARLYPVYHGSAETLHGAWFRKPW
eukprot:EG_transcript_12198